jgi:nucleoside-diphosphate-sugar epimerase
MRVLVLGGTGFIGRHVTRRLSEAGHAVCVFHRGQTKAELPPGVRSLHGDRKRLADHAADFARLAPDVVIDINPYTEADARAAVAAFRGVARRLVALSSGDVYRNYDGLRRTSAGEPDPGPLAEDAPLRTKLYPYRGAGPGMPEWADDYDKILVERVVLGAGDPAGTVLRLPMVYGPGDAHHRPFPYLKRMDDGRAAVPLAEGFAGWRWTRGYVENVAAAVALAATDGRAAGRVYNVGEPDALSEAEWVAVLGRAAGWRGEVVAVPRAAAAGLPGPDYDWRFDLATDTRRLRRELGFAEPVAREEVLRRTVAWERANPPANVPPGMIDYAAEDAALAAARGPAAGPGRGSSPA